MSEVLDEKNNETSDTGNWEVTYRYMHAIRYTPLENSGARVLVDRPQDAKAEDGDEKIPDQGDLHQDVVQGGAEGAGACGREEGHNRVEAVAILPVLCRGRTEQREESARRNCDPSKYLLHPYSQTLRTHEASQKCPFPGGLAIWRSMPVSSLALLPPGWRKSPPEGRECRWQPQ